MEGGAMMEGGGIMEGEGGGALELTHLGSSSHSFRRRPWGIVVMGGHCHCLLVGRHPCVLEGCARGGARRPSWFQCDGLRVVVGVRVGGGLSLPVGACRSWVRLWLGHRCGGQGVSVGGGSLSMGETLFVCACGRCWWWRSSPMVAVEQWWVVAAVHGGGGHQPVMVVIEWWPSSLGDGGGDCC